MKNMIRKWWIALVALLCMAPATFAIQVQYEADKKCDAKHPKNCQPCDAKHPKDCQQSVPEGGSSLVYVLGAGVACLGAMLVRSRFAKPKA